MRALLLAGVALAAGVQNPALSLQTPAGVSLGNSQPSRKSHDSSRKTQHSRKPSAGGRALNLAAPYAETEIITEGLQDVPMSASRFAKEESRVTNEVSVAPVAVVPVAGAPLPDVPVFTVPSASVEPITVEPITVGSSEPMSAARFADEESKIANEVPSQQQMANEVQRQEQQVDPAAALPIKRLAAKQQQETQEQKQQQQVQPTVITTGAAAPMQETIVDSQDSMSAARFADQQSKTGMPQHIQAPELVPLSQQQQVDPAAALPIKRLKEKSVKWDTDILPTLPKAEWLGDRPTNTSCVSIDVGTADSWCQTMCATTTDNPLVLASTCPEKTCRCDAESKAVAKADHDEVIDNWHEAEARVRTAEVDTAYPDGLPHFEDSKPTPDLPTKAKRDHLSADPNTCRAIHIQATDHWCATQCATEECPLTLCKCDDLEAPEQSAQEKSTDEWAGTPYDKNLNSGGDHGRTAPSVPIQSGRVKSLQPATCRAVRDDATDEYCVILCATQDCPLDLCKCADTPTMEEVKEAARREAAEAEKRGTESIVPTLPQAETEVPGRDGPIDISEDGAATVVPLVDTDSTVPKGIKELAAQCFSTVDSGNPGGQYANDLWCKTTCANHNCPKAQCECGPDMEYVTEKDVWQKDKKPTWASKRDEKNAKKQEEKQATQAETEEEEEEKHARWKMKQHGPKWNAKHDPDMAAIRASKHRGGGKRGRKGEDEEEDEEYEEDYSEEDEEGSDYDHTISLRRSAKTSAHSRQAPWSAQKAALAQHAQQHAKHLKHAQHAKHQAHVKHGAHAQRALDRMQSDYAQREQARDEKRAISAREADSIIVVEPPARSSR